MANTVIVSYTFPGRERLEIARGDLTAEPVEAIVNAANSALQHGGGVAGLIAQRGGPQIQAESDAWVRAHGRISHDRPAVTSAGRLPFRYIIHAVGPIWGTGAEDEKLGAAIRGSLALADELGLRSLAMPAISTGIFGFPKARAARIFFETIAGYFGSRTPGSLQWLRLALYEHGTVDVFVAAFDEWQKNSGIIASREDNTGAP